MYAGASSSDRQLFKAALWLIVAGAVFLFVAFPMSRSFSFAAAAAVSDLAKEEVVV